METRKVEAIHPATPASDGAGVRLQRNIAPELQHRLDPFLLLDEFRSDNPDDYIAGFPNHPHRGFETVTYMLAGRMRHKDSVGNEGVLEPGSVQWMKAGRGVVHSEMPEQKDGLLRGFQLWINLPSEEKLSAPEYEELGASRIPLVQLADGVEAHLVAGELGGASGPIRTRRTKPLYVDLKFEAGANYSPPIPAGHNAFLYVFEGNLEIAGETATRAQQVVVLSPSAERSEVQLRAEGGPARALLLAGAPLNEPIVQIGPFVMNSRAEIEEAFADYQAGRLGS